MQRTIYYHSCSTKDTPVVVDPLSTRTPKRGKRGNTHTPKGKLKKYYNNLKNYWADRGVVSRRKWTSAAALEQAVHQYFESCFQSDTKTITFKDGTKEDVEVFVQIKAYTITGLLVYLDMGRAALDKYMRGDDPEYRIVVQRARSRIEAYAEEMLFTGKAGPGVMFSLKNSFSQDWKDATHTNLSGGLNNMVNVSVNDDRARLARATLLKQSQGEREAPQLTATKLIDTND